MGVHERMGAWARVTGVGMRRSGGQECTSGGESWSLGMSLI